MSRASVPPPDFRYVGLEPASPTFGRWRELGTALLLAAAGLLLAAGIDGTSLIMAATLALAAVLVWRWADPSQSAPEAKLEYLAIVPWGVLVHSPAEPRVLRWDAVKSIQVRYVHQMDGPTPRVRWSVVTIETPQANLVGRHPGVVSLERLEAHLDVYCAQAASPVALDASGRASRVTDLEPVVPRLLDYVRRALHAPGSLPELDLSAAGYRTCSRADLSEVGQAVLRRWLVDPPLPGSADKRPLAALFAAELGAVALVDELVRLVTSPHPFVAATARAAAFRLRADIRRVGALEELAEFLPAWELEALEAWSQQASERADVGAAGAGV